MVAVCNNLPVASTIANLQPVRSPGSKPKVTFAPAGAAIIKSFKLREKTLIASTSACSRNCPNNSVSKLWLSFTFHVVCTTFVKNSAAAWPVKRRLKCSVIICCALENAPSCPGSVSIFNDKSFSLRPRNMANMRCDGTDFNNSECSK